MSIRLRKKQARTQAAREAKNRAMRPRKPALEALALPEDVSGDSARVILLGGGRALIENLRGVADIGRETIRLTVRGGSIVLHGEALRLTDVRADAVAVVGQIDSVELPRAACKENGHG